MGAGKTIGLIFLGLIYIGLVFLDIGSNLLLGWIPWMGAALETLSETVIEALSALTVVFMMIVGAKK